MLYIQESFRILGVPLVKSISKFVNFELLKSLQDEILIGMQETIDNFDFIFEQVPQDFGFSKKAKEHLKTFFSDNERNRRISKIYLSYLQ
jgi:hypothetical protein